MRRPTLLLTVLPLVMICVPARAQETAADAAKRQAASVAAQSRVEAALIAAKQSIDQTVRDKIKIEVMSATSGVLGPAVTGAPYSAVTTNESVQTLADGNRIVQRSSYNVARDGQGRIRREELNEAGVAVSVMILDPVARTSYVLDPANRTARQIAMLNVADAGWSTGANVGFAYTVAPKIAAEDKARAGASTFVYGNSLSVVTPAGKDTGVRRESLGTQDFEGVTAEGIRTVRTIPAGKIGNERPIDTVSEQWYSKDLQITIMSRQADPRTGETTYRVTNIRRGEPDPFLFQVPSDYTVTRMMEVLPEKVKK